MPWLVTTGPALLQAGLFGIAFLVVALGIGRRELIWLSFGEGASELERVLLALTLGGGTLQLIPFALGMMGALSTGNVRIASGVVAVGFGMDTWRGLLESRRAFGRLRVPGPWFKIWVLALAPGLLAALLSACTPTIDPDGLGYHLTVPKRWLSLGSLSFLPTYPYSNTPMGVEMLFTLGLSWAGDTAAKMTHFVLGMVAAGSLYAATKRLANDLCAALAVSLFFVGPFGVTWLMGYAYVEAATACALIGSGLGWLIWYQRRDTGALRVAGLCAGIGASFKMTAGLFPVALTALTLALLWREKREQEREWSAVLAPVVGLLVFVALPVLPWLARAALVTGNPFYPMFASIIPSRDFTALQSKQFDQYNRYMVWGVGTLADWGLGIRKATIAASAAIIACIGWIAYRRQRSFPARATTALVLATVLVQLLAAGLYKRYWIPLLAILELPMLLAIAPLLAARAAQPLVLGATALLSLFTTRQIVSNANGDVAGLVKTTLGLEDQASFMRRQVGMLPLFEKVNHEAPPDAGVLLTMNCGGFHIDRRTFCLDIVQNSLRLSSWEEFEADLLRLNVTHVIGPREWEQPVTSADPVPPLGVGNTSYLVRHQEHIVVSRLLHEHGKLIERALDQGLYLIDRPSLK